MQRSAAPAAKRLGPLLLAWGRTSSRQLGDGTVMDTERARRGEPAAGLKATSASVASFGLAVTTSGQVHGVGPGAGGRAGQRRHLKDRYRPVPVKLPRGVRSRPSVLGSTSRWR